MNYLLRRLGYSFQVALAVLGVQQLAAAVRLPDAAVVPQELSSRLQRSRPPRQAGQLGVLYHAIPGASQAGNPMQSSVHRGPRGAQLASTDMSRCATDSCSSPPTTLLQPTPTALTSPR